MNKQDELLTGKLLLVVILFFGMVAMRLRPSPTPEGDGASRSFAGWVRNHYTPIVAGIMAYGCYVGADFAAGAPFPQFLRDHLFDGLAPAAIVGILIELYPGDDPTKALSKLKRPITILLLFFIGGAMVFGLIAVAAVFSAGGDYESPLTFVTWIGGYVFVLPMVLRRMEQSYGESFRSQVMWWFKKR